VSFSPKSRRHSHHILAKTTPSRSSRLVTSHQNHIVIQSDQVASLLLSCVISRAVTHVAFSPNYATTFVSLAPSRAFTFVLQRQITCVGFSSSHVVTYVTLTSSRAATHITFSQKPPSRVSYHARLSSQQANPYHRFRLTAPCIAVWHEIKSLCGAICTYPYHQNLFHTKSDRCFASYSTKVAHIIAICRIFRNHSPKLSSTAPNCVSHLHVASRSCATSH
jgi:hypothetical protein